MMIASKTIRAAAGAIHDHLPIVARMLLQLALLITIVAIFVPLNPGMPAVGLDYSWIFGMNEAKALGLRMGHDLIFTFGPYASIFTKSFHPATDRLMLIGSIYLALHYWTCLCILMRGVRWIWPTAVLVILAALISSPDALLFSLVLVTALVLFKKVVASDKRAIENFRSRTFLVFLFFPFGLLPLIKGSLLLLCVAICGLGCALLATQKRFFAAAICLGGPLLAVVSFWLLSGQALSDLPGYFVSMAPIMSGYTEAMALDGDISEVIAYGVASVLFFLIILTRGSIAWSHKIFLLLVYAAFLLLAFKGGFVRHDGHATVSSASLLWAGILFQFVSRSRASLPALFIFLLGWGYIDSHYNSTSIQSIHRNFVATFSSAFAGLQKRVGPGDQLGASYDTALSAIGAQANFPLLSGSTDIYSYQQSYLIASGNTWSPRPIFQSYSAYTPHLAEINRRHLLGPTAPQNIFFSVEPIDGRLPSTEDGASWPVLMANYIPVEISGRFVLLRKRDEKSLDVLPTFVRSEEVSLGRSFELPPIDGPVYARINITPTFMGRLANLLFKPEHLQISLELENGLVKQFRLVAGLAESGFLISPLVENNFDFSFLYAPDGYLQGRRVRSMMVSSGDSKSSDWQRKYQVSFYRLNRPHFSDWKSRYNFDAPDNVLSDVRNADPIKCEGSIDQINDLSPYVKQLELSGVFKIDGWVALSVDKSLLPNTIYVVLTDSEGKRQYVSTHLKVRSDVATYFGKEIMAKSGYEAIVDLTGVRAGSYTVEIDVKSQDQVHKCQGFAVAAKVR